VRSTEVSEAKLHDTLEEVDSDEVGVGFVNVAAFARIGVGADDEEGAGGAADDVDGGEEDFCATAERVTLSERRGHDGSFA
jgi:hypothetical protein